MKPWNCTPLSRRIAAGLVTRGADVTTWRQGCSRRSFSTLKVGNGCHYTPRTTKLLGGILVSVRPSVRPSHLPCPLCNIYSSGWILSILATNDHYHERVCRTQWPLTLTYIFKVIWPWLRKSCPLCSVYSSGWILFIFSTNDHYH